MRFLLLACDYDETLARHGRVDDATMAALSRLTASGRKLMLVTGRSLRIFGGLSDVRLFTRLVVRTGRSRMTPCDDEAPRGETSARIRHSARDAESLRSTSERSSLPRANRTRRPYSASSENPAWDTRSSSTKGRSWCCPQASTRERVSVRRSTARLFASQRRRHGDAENDHAFLKDAKSPGEARSCASALTSSCVRGERGRGRADRRSQLRPIRAVRSGARSSSATRHHEGRP
jgi:hypothetical protein